MKIELTEQEAELLGQIIRNAERRIFTNECFGINHYEGESGVINLLFGAEPRDNFGTEL